MPVPALILDGAAPYGSFTLAFSSGVTIIADNFDFQQPYTKAEDRTVTGAPNRARWTKERGTGTATLQSPSAATSGRPKPGDTFSVLFDDNYSTINFVVTGVPFNATNEPGDIRKFQITFEQAIGAITTVA